MYISILVSLALFGNGNAFVIGNFSCPDDSFLKDQQYCFKAFEQPELTFSDARDACGKLQRNGDLADMYMSYVSNTIKGLLTEGKRYWIGLKKTNVSEGSSLSRMNGGGLAYSLPWASGEPNNLGGNETCVEMIGNGDGTWNDKECTTKRPYVCEIYAKKV